MAGKVFISYRRDDSKADARNLRDRLAAEFGPANVFMDVDNLSAGQRFDQQLDKALNRCDVLIALIGPRWLDSLVARSRSGERDFVREEIAAALSRQIVVIPVTIDRTPLPPPERLPPDIRALALHQKVDISHERFGRDVDDLIRALVSSGKGFKAKRKTSLGLPLAAAALGAALLGGYLALPRLGQPDGGGDPPSSGIRSDVATAAITPVAPQPTAPAYTKRIVAKNITEGQIKFVDDYLMSEWRKLGLADDVLPYQWIGNVEGTNFDVFMQCRVPVAGESVFFARKIWTNDFAYSSRITDPATLVTGSDEEAVTLAKAGNLDCLVQVVSADEKAQQ